MISKNMDTMFRHAWMKWDWAVKQWRKEGYYKAGEGNLLFSEDELIEKFPELEEYESHCSFCNKYCKGCHECKNCPLIDKEGRTCHSEYSIFYKAYFNNDKRSAIKLCNLIKKKWDEAKRK